MGREPRNHKLYTSGGSGDTSHLCVSDSNRMAVASCYGGLLDKAVGFSRNLVITLITHYPIGVLAYSGFAGEISSGPMRLNRFGVCVCVGG